MKLQKLDQAIAAYRRGLALDPSNADAHNNLAEALLTQRQHDEAAPHFEEALRLKPDMATAYHNLAMIHYFRGDKLQALNVIVQGLRVNETPFLKGLFVTCLRFASTIPDSSTVAPICRARLVGAVGASRQYRHRLHRACQMRSAHQAEH